jgi:hypothetical protein
MRKWNLNAFTRLAAVALLFLEPVYVNAQALQIADVKVRLFFQYSGELSTPLTGKDELWNIMAGGGGFSEPANSAFVDVTVSGVPKTYVEQTNWENSRPAKRENWNFWAIRRNPRWILVALG